MIITGIPVTVKASKTSTKAITKNNTGMIEVIIMAGTRDPMAYTKNIITGTGNLIMVIVIMGMVILAMMDGS
jgi:hypothetical protein